MRLALLVVAACGSSAPPNHDVAQHVDDSVASRPGAPTIAWQANAFAVTGLPAVARAGELAVVPVIESDGGRGFPNLRIEARDRTDKVVQKIAVMTSNEYETLAPGGTPSKSLGDRVATANAELAKAHGLHDLVAMHALELQDTTDGSDKHLAIGDSLDVDWDHDHLHVFPHNVNHPLATVDGTPWLAKDTTHVGGDVCHNLVFLKVVYHAIGINLIVVELGYHGTDTCWEPSAQQHVVVW